MFVMFESMANFIGGKSFVMAVAMAFPGWTGDETSEGGDCQLHGAWVVYWAANTNTALHRRSVRLHSDTYLDIIYI